MRIGPHEVLSELGRGGMGAVFRARSPRGEAVAVKVLLRLDAARLARFERERRLLGSFTAREGFVPLLEAGTHEGTPYLVMPLLEGGTLRERLAAGPLGVDETLSLGRALAAALGRAHEKGIVHRDLKPENILFTADGRPLVADLGLAKHFDRDTPGASGSVSLSRPGELRGTAGYMAPEQIADAKSAGPAADVFALGVILHECLAGVPAFPGENMLDVLRNIETGKVSRLARKDVPDWLVAAIERALARDPARRFRDGSELHRALGGPAKEARSRRRASLVVLALLSILVVVGLRAVRGPGRRELFDRAAARQAQGDLDGAIADYGRVLELDPGDYATLDNRANLRRRKGDLEGALADLDQAIRLSPPDAAVFFNRGNIRQTRGDVEGAIADYDRSIELDPSRWGAFNNRGLMRRVKGDAAGALSDFDRAAALEPRDAMPLANRGDARQVAGDLQGALSDFDRAIALDPGLGAAYRGRGIARHARGDLRGALSDEGRAIELGAGDSRTFVERGDTRQDMGDLDGAISDYDRAIELDPHNVTAFNNRGNTRGKKGDLEEALADHDRAVQLEPNRAAALYGRGNARQAMGNLDGALADFDRAIELDPGLGPAYFGRGNVEQSKGELDPAIVDLGRAFELDPHIILAVKNRGIARRTKGDLAGAVDDFAKTLELDPNDPDAPALKGIIEDYRKEHP